MGVLFSISHRWLILVVAALALFLLVFYRQAGKPLSFPAAHTTVCQLQSASIALNHSLCQKGLSQYPDDHVHACRYNIGKVIGAGSFGVVREAVHKRTNLHYACKTIPKLPKKGRGTPRYLLKIQTEVDAMLQLGPSLDAVYLNVMLLSIIQAHPCCSLWFCPPPPPPSLPITFPNTPSRCFHLLSAPSLSTQSWYLASMQHLPLHLQACFYADFGTTLLASPSLGLLDCRVECTRSHLIACQPCQHPYQAEHTWPLASLLLGL